MPWVIKLLIVASSSTVCEVPVSQNSVLSAEGEQNKDCCCGLRMYPGHRTCSWDIPFLEHPSGTAVFMMCMMLSDCLEILYTTHLWRENKNFSSCFQAFVYLHAETNYIYCLFTLCNLIIARHPCREDVRNAIMHDDYSFLEIMFISNVLVSNTKH